MLRFLVKRLLQGLLVMWGVVTLLFLIFNALGNPAELMVGEMADEETQRAIEKKYHLDKDLFTQYLYYLNDLSPISILNDEDPELEAYSYTKVLGVGGGSFVALKAPFLGRSFQTDQTVGGMILAKVPGTFILAFFAILIAIFLGIPLGMISALKRNTWGDRLITFVTLLGISAPSFFMAVVIIKIFAVDLGSVTGLNVTGYLFEERIFEDGYSMQWANLVLPAIALGVRPLSIITQLTRSSMMEVMGEDYIRTAKAKGLSPRRVVMKHALRNALNPVVTSASGWFASLLAGAFFIETIFDWQGLGKLTIDALNANDYPVILGTALFIGLIFVMINIIVDLLYSRLDPRVKLNS